MNLQYLLKAAEVMEKKAAVAEQNGNYKLALECRDMAAKKYQEAAQADPQKSGEYLARARDVKNAKKVPVEKHDTKEATRAKENKSEERVQDEESGEEKKTSEPGITFDDVAGLEDVKNNIRFSVLEPLRNPKMAELFRVKPGAKIMLYGPPGTGKTFIAKAIAGEIDAEFFSVNCQDLISKYMGESSKKLDELFDKALENERAIIFFDEFDSVASKRSDSTQGADAEMSRFVATFLTKVDGFKKSKTNKMLLLIAATNRPWAIDSAMIRGGRFDTHIYVGVPDQAAREFLVNKVLDGIPKDDNVSIKEIASKLCGFGGGDITAICEKIKMKAYGRSIEQGSVQNVTQADCDSVIDKSHNVITEEELLKFEKFRNASSVN